MRMYNNAEKPLTRVKSNRTTALHYLASIDVQFVNELDDQTTRTLGDCFSRYTLMERKKNYRQQSLFIRYVSCNTSENSRIKIHSLLSIDQELQTKILILTTRVCI